MGCSTEVGIKTILLVNGGDYLVTFLEKLLAYEGYNVVTASNSKHAVDVYKSHQEPIDIVLVNISMPIMDVLESHKELIEYDPDVPILIMSDYSREQLIGLEHLYFIRKPMHPSELFKSIKKIFESSTSTITYC